MSEHRTGTGRRVLVTGAAGGLGAALVERFLAAGDRVLATDLREPASSGGPADFLTLDVTSDDDWAAARDWVEEHWNGLDVLVNNAGVAGGGRVDVATIDEWRWIFETNLFGVVRGTRTFTPVFKLQRSGHVVNIASLAGLVHPAGMASYNAVKAAVVALTETTGHELSPYDVHATAVCPGFFRTDLMDSLRGADQALAEVVRGFVEHSKVTADEVAGAVLQGIEDGAELVVPDAPARAAYALKLSDHESYNRVMRAGARSLAQAPLPEPMPELMPEGIDD